MFFPTKYIGEGRRGGLAGHFRKVGALETPSNTSQGGRMATVYILPTQHGASHKPPFLLLLTYEFFLVDVIKIKASLSHHYPKRLHTTFSSLSGFLLHSDRR